MNFNILKIKTFYRGSARFPYLQEIQYILDSIQYALKWPIFVGPTVNDMVFFDVIYPSNISSLEVVDHFSDVLKNYFKYSTWYLELSLNPTLITTRRFTVFNLYKHVNPTMRLFFPNYTYYIVDTSDYEEELRKKYFKSITTNSSNFLILVSSDPYKKTVWEKVKITNLREDLLIQEIKREIVNKILKNKNLF